jgi:hypothetical protein
VSLSKSIHYTRPLFEFLSSLDGDGASGLVAALGDGRHLSEGPEVETKQSAADTDSLRLQIAETVKRWHSSGLCVPEEVLILYSRSDLESSVIGKTDKVGEYSLIGIRDHGKGIRHCSIHKAKGLDSIAVILVGVASPNDTEMSAYNRFTLFMGASRARQILAIIAPPNIHTESS